jgi:hypothetical protein
MGHEPLQRLGRDARERSVVARARLAHELRDQERDVLAALAQRRQMDAEDVEPIVQVAPELLERDELPEILVGRRDDADVDVDGVLAADAQELALLEHAQELGLRRDRHLADLVEEDGAAVRELEEPSTRVDRPVNAPFSCPNSSLSSSVSGSAATLTAMKRLWRRTRAGGARARPAPCPCPTHP